jgi:putative phosphoribosyl transferase
VKEDTMDGIFQDRRAAGRQLARALAERGYEGDAVLVLGIPRGGVPVAEEVARALHAPLDVVISRKLRAPYQPELAIGAVVSGDHLQLLNEELADAAGATPEYLEREVRTQQAEIERRMRTYHGDRPPPRVEGRTVIVIDDGIATGYTFRAALQGIRRLRPGRLVAAVPVAPRESLPAVGRLADDLVCLETPEPFWAVGAWYADFSPTTDEEVIAILRRHWAQESLEHREAQRPSRGRAEREQPAGVSASKGGSRG